MKNKNNSPAIFTETRVLQGTSGVIFTVAAIILLFMLGHSSLIGAEAETADALRELMAGKDVFAPETSNGINDISSLWNCRIRSIPAMIFGINELTCRLPSVFAALLMLCGTMLLSKEFFNRRTMYTIGWMTAGCCGFVYWGRFAGNYMTLAVWAVWSAVTLRYFRNNLWWWFLFFAMIFIGAAWWGMNYLLLLPGIIFITMPHWRWKLNFRWQIPAAAGLALLTVTIILFTAVNFTELTFWQCLTRLWHLVSGTFMESVQISIWPTGSKAWHGENFWNLYRLLFPWGLPAIFALYSAFSKIGKLPESHRCLLYGTMLILLLTAVFPARQWQYQLPAVPFLLIITGAVITGGLGEIRYLPYLTRVMIWIISIFCSFAVALLATWPLWKIVLLTPPPLSLMLLVPVLGLAGLAFIVFDTGYKSAVERISGMRGPWSGYILGGLCITAATLAVGHPSLTIYRSGKPFWVKCGEATRHLPSREVIFAGEPLPATARYYMALPERCTVTPDIAGLPEALKTVSIGEARLIIRKKFLAEAGEVLKNTGWQIITGEYIVEEGGLISFSREKLPGEEKFVLCRVIRKK